MIWPMLALAWMFNIVERGSAAYGRIRSMLEEAPVVNDGSETVPEGRGALNVAVREFIYPQATKPSLEKVNFTPAAGANARYLRPDGSREKAPYFPLFSAILMLPRGISVSMIFRCLACSLIAGAGGWRWSIKTPIPVLRYRGQ